MIPSKQKKAVKTPMNPKVKWGLILTLSTIAAVALAIGGYFTLRKPRPRSDSPEDIARFVASKDFNRLSNKERQAYLQKMRPPEGQRRMTQVQNMSQTERDAFRDNMMRVFEQERTKQMRQYFALKSQEDKNAFLDAEIQKMEERRAQWNQQRQQQQGQQGQQQGQRQQRGAPAAGTQPAGQQRPRPSESEMAARTRSRVETTSPESRAMRSQYMRDLQARAKATGKNVGGRPGGGGGGGGGGRPGGRPGGGAGR